MASDNQQISFTGRLGKDPEMKNTAEGKALVRLSVATNRWDGQAKAEVGDWYNVTLFGQQAEFIATYAHKGSRVAVFGRPQLRKYDKQDGSQGLSVDVVCDGGGVVLLDAKPAGSNGHAATPSTSELAEADEMAVPFD